MISYANKNGSITAATGEASKLELACIGLGSTGLDIRGTFTATLVPEASINNVDFFTVDANPVGGGAAVNSITAAGAWTINTSGYSTVRVRCSAYTSGTAVATLVSTLDAGVNNNIEVSLGEQDIEIGAVELKDAATDSRASIEAANTARTTATKVIAVQHVDATGAVLSASARTISSISAGSTLIGDVGISGARTTGGTTPYKNLDVDESEDEVKGTAGQVYWMHVINLSAAKLYLKFYNATAANVTVGTTVPVLTLPIPTLATTNGNGFVLSIPNGIAFSTAITVAATTGFADNDVGAPGANEVILNLGYA